jgi:nitrate/nitrite transport system ATP-binding protein
MNRFLELSRLTKTFPTPRGDYVVVRDFDLRLAEGELVALIGHSGCGKSTVLSMVAGLTEPTSGGVLVDGKEIDGAGPDRGVVFQSPALLPWLTAFENVLLGVEQVHRNESASRREEIAAHHLELVGLGDALHVRPRELSQGMQQRVGLARAFALSPRVLLLDEPFGMLDSITRVELQAVLLRLWTQHRQTALLVTHDVDEALLLSDRVVMMTQGPESKVGGIIPVPFKRPRDRDRLLDDPRFEALREQLLGFLDHQVEAKLKRVS